MRVLGLVTQWGPVFLELSVVGHLVSFPMEGVPGGGP